MREWQGDFRKALTATTGTYRRYEEAIAKLAIAGPDIDRAEVARRIHAVLRRERLRSLEGDK